MAVLVEWTNKHTVIMRMIDSIDGAEVVEAILTFSGDARFDDIRGLIYDWSAYRFVPGRIDIADIEQMAEIIRAVSKSNRNVRQAVVLMDGTIEHRGAFFSMFEVLTADVPWQTGSFDTLEQALAWLGMDHS